MYRGSDISSTASSNPSIWLLKEKNTLRVSVGLQTNNVGSGHTENPKKLESNESCGDTCGENIDMCDIENIPIQKWFNLNIALHNNILDIYINGELQKSCILKGFPINTNGELNLGKDGGFNGSIYKLKISNSYLSYDAIKKIYNQGR